jgi:hypothetical protein
MKHIFPRQIFEKALKYEVSWEVRPVEAALFNADRRAVRYDEANLAFLNFANVPKKLLLPYTALIGPIL